MAGVLTIGVGEEGSRMNGLGYRLWIVVCVKLVLVVGATGGKGVISTVGRFLILILIFGDAQGGRKQGKK